MCCGGFLNYADNAAGSPFSSLREKVREARMREVGPHADSQNAPRTFRHTWGSPGSLMRTATCLQRRQAASAAPPLRYGPPGDRAGAMWQVESKGFW